MPTTFDIHLNIEAKTNAFYVSESTASSQKIHHLLRAKPAHTRSSLKTPTNAGTYRAHTIQLNALACWAFAKRDAGGCSTMCNLIPPESWAWHSSETVGAALSLCSPFPVLCCLGHTPLATIVTWILLVLLKLWQCRRVWSWINLA